jgi:crotonobetaine/carnitine-CoA ligase
MTEDVVIDLIGNRTVPGLLRDQADARPDHPAVVFEDPVGATRAYTYRELLDAVLSAAGGFAALGVRPGDKVVMSLSNCPEAVLTLFGLAVLGAVTVPCNTAGTADELTHIARWSDARFAVTDPAYLVTWRQVQAHTSSLQRLIVTGPEDDASDESSFVELLTAAPLDADAVRSAEAPLEILFTSGTTALPKGVVLTHANWLWSGERSSRTLRLDEADRLLTALPLFHVNAQSLTLMNALTLGATAILLEQFSARRFIAQIREHRATHTSLVAMLVRTLLAQPEDPADGDHALRRVSYAINVSDEEKDRFERRFAVELINGYGLSEAMTEVTVCPVSGPRRWPSIGLPVIDRQVRIVDDDGREVPDGETGEITVHGIPGRTIMREYYKDPEATARAVVDGWLYTGDNGYFDERGYLYFVDRSKDIIKRAGENVSASEVERVLLEHGAIVQAAVIAVPDPMRDEAVKAFVVLAEDETLTEEDVQSYCAGRLARFKIPTIVEFRAELPMTSIGKVEKRRLREEVTVP